MTEKAPAVVIIVTYNSAHVIGPALDSLREHEVQLIDNGSIDSTLELARSYPNVRIRVNERNVGYGAAVNVAAALHPGRDICLLNPDVVMSPGTVEGLASHCTGWPTGVVAPRLVNPDGSLQYSARNYQTLGVVLASRTPLRRTRLGQRLQQWHLSPSMGEGVREVPWVTGAAMYFDRRAFDSVGGFDSAYFMYHEDQDICLRLRKQGWRIRYVPTLTGTHAHARASRSNARAVRRHLVSTAKFYRRHPQVLVRRALEAKGAALPR